MRLDCSDGGPTAVLTLRMKTRDLDEAFTAGRRVEIRGTAQLYSVEAADWKDTEKQLDFEFISIDKLQLIPA